MCGCKPRLRVRGARLVGAVWNRTILGGGNVRLQAAPTGAGTSGRCGLEPHDFGWRECAAASRAYG